MDLNKSAGSPKSPDAKTEGGLVSSPPVNVKAEKPSTAEAETLVAPPRKAAGSPKKDSAIVPEGIRQRESYCLFVRVQKDGDAIPKREQRIDPEAWNETICRNICENWLNALPGTFNVQLLSETEFLLYEGKERRTRYDLGSHRRVHPTTPGDVPLVWSPGLLSGWATDLKALSHRCIRQLLVPA